MRQCHVESILAMNQLSAHVCDGNIGWEGKGSGGGGGVNEKGTTFRLTSLSTHSEA